jgi:hypothetical protein
MAEVAITTAVTGAYDHPRSEVHPSGYDYFFFADEESEFLCPPWWQLVKLEPRDTSARRRAKAPKINPHQFEFLRDYDYVIWIDGGITIKDEKFPDQILSYLENGMVLSPHFDDRNDAYSEATIRPRKYADEPLDVQCDFYREQGYPGNNGLYECGVLARNMKSDIVCTLGNLWNQQVENWSIQDQVSLPYCLWRLEYQPDVLPKSFRDFDWVDVHAHRRED